jgi:hypothetical protein
MSRTHRQARPKTYRFSLRVRGIATRKIIGVRDTCISSIHTACSEEDRVRDLEDTLPLMQRIGRLHQPADDRGVYRDIYIIIMQPRASCAERVLLYSILYIGDNDCFCISFD